MISNTEWQSCNQAIESDIMDVPHSDLKDMRNSRVSGLPCDKADGSLSGVTKCISLAFDSS